MDVQIDFTLPLGNDVGLDRQGMAAVSHVAARDDMVGAAAAASTSPQSRSTRQRWVFAPSVTA